MPDPLPRRGRRRLDLLDEPVVVAHQAGDLGAERHHAGAGEGGEVDDRVGLGLGGERQAVGQDQTTLGVGVEHLDRLAVADLEHVAGAGGVTAEHVVGHRNPGPDLAWDLEVLQHRHGADDRRGAAHVALHRHHALAGLDRQAAGIEGDALADEGEEALRLALRRVGQLDEAGRVGRPAVDAEQAAELALLDRGFVPDLDGETLLLGHRGGPAGEDRRGEGATRLVDEIAGEHLAPGDRGTTGDGGLILGPAAAGDLDRLELRGLAVGLVGEERVAAEREAFGECTPSRRAVEFGVGKFDADPAVAAELAGGAGRGVADRRRVDVGSSTHADQDLGALAVGVDVGLPRLAVEAGLVELTVGDTADARLDGLGGDEPDAGLRGLRDGTDSVERDGHGGDRSQPRAADRSTPVRRT